MIDLARLSGEALDEANKLEAAADETFGAGTRHMRLILGICLGSLADAGGLPATRAYLENTLRLIRRLDDEDLPPSPPPAS